jgi:two-component sensor histidine kinase
VSKHGDHRATRSIADELNHRLKNNLQMLYAILQAAFRKAGNPEAREVLSDTSRRIAGMGTAQQAFYSVHNSTDVSGPQFIEAVCANARVFFSKEVSISYAATTGSLPKDTAMPLALVLNELLTNAAKHGANESRLRHHQCGPAPALGVARALCARPRTRIQL